MNFDFNKATKTLFDGSLFGLGKYFITMAIFAGPTVSCVAIVPEDAKRLRDVLSKTIEQYEMQYGEIPDSNQPVPSPVDLSKPL